MSSSRNTIVYVGLIFNWLKKRNGILESLCKIKHLKTFKTVLFMKLGHKQLRCLTGLFKMFLNQCPLIGVKGKFMPIGYLILLGES